MSFMELRSRWLHWLEHDPVQSIWKQIHSIIWDDATFRAINETRSYTTGEKWLSQNGMLARFIDSSYVAGQSLALARLVDGRSDVISLRRLINELRRHRTTVTRSAYLAIADLPHDYAAVHDAAIKRISQISRNGVWVSAEPTSGPDAWSVAERQHRTFDRLSQSAKRKPDDCLSEAIIDKLDSWLSDPSIKQIVRVRHKFVAHAADFESRNASDTLPGGLTLNVIEAAHRVVFRVAAAISGTILYDDSHISPVPIPQDDQFVYWDRGLLPPERYPDLYEHWDKYEDQRGDWAKSLVRDLLGPDEDDEDE